MAPGVYRGPAPASKPPASGRPRPHRQPRYYSSCPQSSARTHPWTSATASSPAIGNTPLIKLRKASELTGCTILGKAEFLNPGGSVKDRAAKYMVLDAERRGVLEPGGLIVEGTAGNTGIGLRSSATRAATAR